MVARYTIASALSFVLILAFISTEPVQAAVGDNEEAGTPVKVFTLDANASGEPPAAPIPNKKQKPSYTPPKPKSTYQAEDWTVAVYPILAWAPIMGGHIDVPNLPPLPSHPSEVPSTNLSGGLNGAALFGFGIQKKWFVTDVSVLWASIGASSDQTNSSLDTSFLFYDATAGVKLYKDLSISAGVRHLGLKMDVKIADFPSFNWKPGINDPILALNWRRSLSKHWGFDIAVKGGGFGVGSDVDLSATGRLDWRFARHFGLTMGYGGLHFKITDKIGVLGINYDGEVKQTLHGPIFGFGIYF